MQRRRQPTARADAATFASRPNEMERAITLQQIEQSCAATKVIEIRATAERDVLAMIDEQAAFGVAKRAGAAAQLPSGFEQLDVQAAIGEAHGCGQTGQTAADNCDTR